MTSWRPHRSLFFRSLIYFCDRSLFCTSCMCLLVFSSLSVSVCDRRRISLSRSLRNTTLDPMYKQNFWMSRNNTNIEFVLCDLFAHLSMCCFIAMLYETVTRKRSTFQMVTCTVVDAEHVRCKRGTAIGCSATTLHKISSSGLGCKVS